MVQPESDWKFWQVIVGCVLSAGGGLIGGGWVSRGVLESLRQADRDLDGRVTRLEKQLDALASMSISLAVLTALQKEMKEDIKAIFGRLDRREADAPHQEERRINHDDTA
jgi:hypothetical protein